MSRRPASLNFSMLHSLRTLEFTGYSGRLAGADRRWEDYVDTQDDTNGINGYEMIYTIQIRPVNVEADKYQLITQGRQLGGRRYRYGTLNDMIGAAEKWAGRRFKIEQKEVNA